MVEPISISSGIAGLLTLAITVAEKSYEYASNVRGASATIASYLQELSALKAILFKLNELTETHAATARLAKASPSLLSAMNMNECQKELEMILGKLRKHSEGSALSALAWPFVERDIKKHVGMLQRYNHLFQMALTADAYTVGSLTLQKVNALRSENQEERSSSRRKAIIDWLFPGKFDDAHTAVRSRRQANTGQWFLEKIQSWLTDSGNTSIFWCRGIPGAGKTILMSAVVDHMESRSRLRSIHGFAYIYFNYKQQGDQTISSIIASIIVQLLAQSPAVQIMVEELFETNQDGKRKAELEDLVNILFNNRSLPKTVLAFDALDEASQQTRKALMHHFSTMRTENLLVFVTSRPDVDLRPVAGKMRLLDVVAQPSDMETFVNARLEGSEDILEMLDDKAEFIIQEIVRAVVAQAEGMFLLAAFQIDYICQQTSAKEMLLALQRLPSEAGSIYLQALEQIDLQSKSQAQLARRVLCWLVLAKSSLTVPELLEALAIETDSTALDSLNRTSAAMLVKACRGLVVVDNNSRIIRLAHLTVHEFLTKNLPELSQMKKEVAVACVTYISFDAFKTGPCDGAYTFGHRLNQFAFYHYACAHCSEHLRDMDLTDRALGCGNLVDFATSKTLSESYFQMLFSYGVEWYYDLYPTQTTPLHVVAALGVGELAHLLFQQYSSCANRQDSHGWTPLLQAIELGHESVVEAFLDHGVDTEGETESPLNCAARNGRDGIVRLLFEKTMVCRGQHRKEEQDLFVAAIVGDLEAITKSIQLGANINVTDIDGGTALQWASWYGHAAVVSCLLAAGSEIETEDKNGRRALHEAAERGRDDVVQVLLQSGAAINAKDRFGYTPLLRAAIAKTPAVASMLLAHGADLSSVDNDGYSALDIAIGMGRLDNVRLLLDSGIDVKDFQVSKIRIFEPITAQQRNQMLQMISKAQRLLCNIEC